MYSLFSWFLFVICSVRTSADGIKPIEMGDMIAGDSMEMRRARLPGRKMPERLDSPPDFT